MRLKGFICTIDENGKATDIGLHDEMLEHEVQIREDLISHGIIKEIKAKRMTPDEIAALEEADRSRT